MSCWSWPSWQCAAGSPLGCAGQACKLDAMLLLSSQAPFLPSSPRSRSATNPASYLWALQGPDQQKKKIRARDGRKKWHGLLSLTPWAVNHPPLRSCHTLIVTHQPLLALLPTRCTSPCPYSPPVPFSLLTPVLPCTSAICTTTRAAIHPASR